VKRSALDLSNLKTIRSDAKLKDSQRLIKGDILMSAASGSKEHVGKVAYVFQDTDLYFGGFMAVIRCTTRIDSRFLFHALTSTSFSNYLEQAITSTTINNLNSSIINGFQLQIPPIEVQREIVSILDKFTELEAELEAELENRKRQFIAVQKQLFMSSMTKSKRQVALRDVGRWYGGGTPSKSVPEYWQEGTIPWISPKDMGSSFLTQTQDQITETAVKNSSTKLVPKDSIAVVVRSSILDHTLPIAFVPIVSSLNQDMRAVVPGDGVLPRYVYHALQAFREDLLLETRRRGGSVASLESKRFFDFEIPIPEELEQASIVNALDSFDALVNDINFGLPAEIKSRRGQYEYYRDKLLTFEELELA
jgi:type I restriction enzyme S subunit